MTPIGVFEWLILFIYLKTKKICFKVNKLTKKQYNDQDKLLLNYCSGIK